MQSEVTYSSTDEYPICFSDTFGAWQLGNRGLYASEYTVKLKQRTPSLMHNVSSTKRVIFIASYKPTMEYAYQIDVANFGICSRPIQQLFSVDKFHAYNFFTYFKLPLLLGNC